MSQQRNTQLIRQWEVLWALNSPQGRTIRGLAEEMGVHPRTINRDLDALEAAGFPLLDVVDERAPSYQKRWRLLHGFTQLPHIPLTREEAFAILAAAQAMRGLDDTPIGRAFHTVLEKLRRVIKPLDIEMNRLRGTYLDDPEIGRRYTEHRDILWRLLRSIDQRRLLTIGYRAAATGQVTERTVAPLALWRSGGELYLIAHCYLRDAPRSFRLDRFISVEPSSDDLPWPDNFDPDEFLRHSFGPWVGEPQRVVLFFPDYDAEFFNGLSVHPTQEVEERPGGGIELRMHVAPSLHLARWLAGYGGEVVVEEPEHLRDWVADIHRSALARVRPG